MSEPVSITDQAVQTITVKRYQCRHIFTDGRRCGSPCLKREEFCYYHHTTRRAAARTRSTQAGQTEAEHAEFDLPLAEDRSAIQISIGEVLRRIARNQIDPRRAGLLLYGLQIASLNIARAAEPARDKELIEEITAHPELGTLAPTTEMTDPAEKRSFATTLIEKFNRKQAEQRQTAAASAAAASADQAAAASADHAAPPHPESAAEPAILASLQAVAHSSNRSAKTKRPPCWRPFTMSRNKRLSRRVGRGCSGCAEKPSRAEIGKQDAPAYPPLLPDCSTLGTSASECWWALVECSCACLLSS